MRYGSVLLMLALTALPCRGQTRTHDETESQPPRRLSDMTKNELAACFKKKSGYFSVVSIANNAEAYRYAEDWREVFLSAGWQTERKVYPSKISESLVVCGMECGWVSTMTRQLRERRHWQRIPRRNFRSMRQWQTRYSTRRTHNEVLKISQRVRSQFKSAISNSHLLRLHKYTSRNPSF